MPDPHLGVRGEGGVSLFQRRARGGSTPKTQLSDNAKIVAHQCGLREQRIAGERPSCDQNEPSGAIAFMAKLHNKLKRLKREQGRCRVKNAGWVRFPRGI